MSSHFKPSFTNFDGNIEMMIYYFVSKYPLVKSFESLKGLIWSKNENINKKIPDDNSSGRASTRGSIRRPEGHLTAAHFARSCSLGVPRASSTNPSSLGQESGFQSCTSLNSLGQPLQPSQQRTSTRTRREQSPALPGVNQIRSSALESSASGSMASLASGLQSGVFSHGQQQRQSLTNLNHPAKLVEDPVLIGNRVSAARHSARLPNAQERQNIIDPRGNLKEKWRST